MNTDWHLRISAIKSGIRIWLCLIALVFGTWQIAIWGIMVAEIFGILEEIAGIWEKRQ